MRIQTYLAEARSSQHLREQVSLQLEEDKSHPVEILTFLAFLAWCYLLQLQTYDELVTFCLVSSTLTYQRRNLCLRTMFLQTMALDKISKVEVFEQRIVPIGGGSEAVGTRTSLTQIQSQSRLGAARSLSPAVAQSMQVRNVSSPLSPRSVPTISRWGVRIRLITRIRIARPHPSRQAGVNDENEGSDGRVGGVGVLLREWQRQWEKPHEGREGRGDGVVEGALQNGRMRGAGCSFTLHCLGWCIDCAYHCVQAYISTAISLAILAVSAIGAVAQVFNVCGGGSEGAGGSESSGEGGSEGCSSTIVLRLGQLVEREDAGALQSLANTINRFVLLCDEGEDEGGSLEEEPGDEYDDEYSALMVHGGDSHRRGKSGVLSSCGEADSDGSDDVLLDSTYDSTHVAYEEARLAGFSAQSRGVRTVLKTDRCCVCLQRRAKVFFLPCRHVVCCPACADNVSTCPCCREPVEQRHTLFI
jgi:hypothetical protein